jgi:hypothetical protein
VIETPEGFVYTYDSGKNRQILAGRIIGNKFIKNVEKRLHYYRNSSSYAIQEIVVQHILDGGVEFVKIREADTGRVFKSKLIRWIKQGKIDDKGYGVQRFLTIRNMKRIK